MSSKQKDDDDRFEALLVFINPGAYQKLRGGEGEASDEFNQTPDLLPESFEAFQELLDSVSSTVTADQLDNDGWQ